MGGARGATSDGRKNCRAACVQRPATRGKNVRVGYHSGFLFLFWNKMGNVMTSSPSSRRFCQAYSQEPLTPPPAADLSDTALIFRLYREKECLKATPYCYRADSLHNHARTPDGSVEQQPSNIIYLQTVSAERDAFVPHNRDNNSKFQQNCLIIC